MRLDSYATHKIPCDKNKQNLPRPLPRRGKRPRNFARVERQAPADVAADARVAINAADGINDAPLELVD